MRFYTGGDFYQNLPGLVRELPIDLLRSRQYPRNPQVLEQGIEELAGGTRPQFYAPQRMGFTRWKTPPTPAGFGQNVISMLGAMRYNMEVRKLAAVHQVPVLDYVDAASAVGANQLPRPTDHLDRNLRRGYVPLSTDVVPLDDVVDVEVLSQLSQDSDAAEELRNDARASALQEIGAYQDRLQMVAMANAGVPWFLR